MFEAKKEQMDAEQALAVHGSTNISQRQIQQSQQSEYITGEIMDPYQEQVQQNQNESYAPQENETYNRLQNKIPQSRLKAASDDTGYSAGHYPGDAVVTDNSTRGFNMGIGGAPYG